MFKVHTRKQRKVPEFGEQDFQLLGQRTEMFSGSDIKVPPQRTFPASSGLRPPLGPPSAQSPLLLTQALPW